MANYSPLRYPGGKGKMLGVIKKIINDNDLTNSVYIEPFAGGGNLALNLLFEGIVKEIRLNDYDLAIYAVWYAILNHNDEFIALIRDTPVTVEEWNNQKRVYQEETENLLQLGFATFYLNRTNRSGIITACPIGGFDQTGNYGIDCRFNKDNLIQRVSKIYAYRKKIKIFNYDAIEFFKRRFPYKSLFFIDPPYYNKGALLYKNSFVHQDHVNISKSIYKLNYNWIVTYDNTEEIIDIYEDSTIYDYELTYSVETKRKGKEILIASSNLNIDF